MEAVFFLHAKGLQGLLHQLTASLCHGGNVFTGVSAIELHGSLRPVLGVEATLRDPPFEVIQVLAQAQAPKGQSMSDDQNQLFAAPCCLEFDM